MLHYLDYTARVEFDDEADFFHGEVLDLRDVITFQGRTPEEIRQAFIDSIDDYLEFCAERGEDPDRPFSGNLTLRLPSELHRKAYVAAQLEGISLNQWIAEKLARSA